MTTNFDPLRALITKWRGSWADGYMTGVPEIDEVTIARASAKKECAGELKAALAQQPAAPSGGATANEERVDRAYAERNALAVAFAKAALAAGWNAGRGYDDDPNKDWDPEWRHVVYVELPDGRQVSWHMSPDEVHLLDGLPTYAGEWDGTFIARDPAWVAALAAQQQGGAA